MCVIPGFPAALLDDPPQPPPAAPTREQHQQSSSDDEHSPKVRKPYTITKQREKWSDEEHDKFLEAVKLYGRAWRRIEEHVGSKTAVQIRSHAQKFFSKVARESTTTAGGDGSSSSSGSNNSSPATATTAAVIEIPPPRPKKRPLHPYPRKQGSTPKKRAPVAATISVVPPHVKPGSCHHHQQHQEENTSPKSVLSAEELIQSPTALKPEACSRGCYGCASSDSSITGPDEAVARQRQETDGSSTMSNGSESYDNMTQEDGRDKDSEHPPAMVSFQLFGQTMFVPNCQSPASSVEESSRHQVTDTLPPLSSDDETSETMEMATDPEVSENPANAHCPCGVVPMLCNPLPTHQQQQQQQWFVFYGGPMTLPFLRLPVTSSQQHHEYSMTVADGSSSGSADSVSGHESSENTPKKMSVNQDAEQSEDRSPRSAFLPYKRQTVVVSQHQPSNAADLSL